MDKGIIMKASMQECPIGNLVIVESNTKSHNYCFLHLYRNIVANISFLSCFPLFLYYFIYLFFFLSAYQHIFARGLTSSNPRLNKASFIHSLIPCAIFRKLCMQNTGNAGPAPPFPRKKAAPPPPASSHPDNIAFC